jgi:pyrimidine-nucleoside phosphorylase
VDDPELFPKPSHIETVASPRSGYIEALNACQVGEIAVLLGGGRAVKDDPIDHSVGIEVLHKVGDYVEAGAPLFTVYASTRRAWRLPCKPCWKLIPGAIEKWIHCHFFMA